jgi:RNA polymerase sigma-70 factor (ECF subfamily)
VKDPSEKIERGKNNMRLPADYLAEKYQENIFRAALSVSKRPGDAEDAVQDAFVQYLRSDRDFESEEHIKACLIRTAINRAKNTVVSFWNRNRIAWEEYMADIPFEEDKDQILVEAVMELPAKYRIVIHLFYYEDYSVSEIGEILNVSQSAIKNRLLRARKMLKEKLKEDWIDE